MMLMMMLMVVAEAGLLRNGFKINGKDPFCKTGILQATQDEEKVCCPAFCSECTTYASCEAAFEHSTDKSKNACCVDVVKEHSCALSGENGLTPVSFPPCVASCDDSLPPCIAKDSDFVFEKPDITAADDCTNAIPEWLAMAKAATEGAAPEGAIEEKLLQTQALSSRCQQSKETEDCVCEITRGDEKLGYVPAQKVVKGTQGGRGGKGKGKAVVKDQAVVEAKVVVEDQPSGGKGKGDRVLGGKGKGKAVVEGVH